MGASLHLNNKTDAIFNTSLGHEMCGPNGNDIAVQTGLWPPLNLRSIYSEQKRQTSRSQNVSFTEESAYAFLFADQHLSMSRIETE
jgi:hypothetical protein